MKYEYNEELDKDVVHLPLFSIYIRKRISDISISGVSRSEAKITTILDTLMTLHYYQGMNNNNNIGAYIAL